MALKIYLVKHGIGQLMENNMFTKRNTLLLILIIIIIVITIIIVFFVGSNNSSVTLISKDKLDLSQQIVADTNTIYYISEDGFLKKINNSTVSTISSVNTSFSPKISYNGENISYINPSNREFTVYRTDQQGSNNTPLVKIDRVAFSQWQDNNNIILVQLSPNQTNFGEYFNTEDFRPNIQGSLIRVNVLTKNKELLGEINLQELLLSNPNYVLYTTKEKDTLLQINKFNIDSKQITQLTKQSISQVKIINNNNILIKSPMDNFPKLIQGATIQEVGILTDTNLITGLNINSIQSLFSITKKKDDNIFSKYNISKSSENVLQKLDPVITNPINTVVLPKQLIIFSQDGIYVVNNNKVTE